MSDNKPIETVSDRGTSISIWRNEGEKGPRYAFQVSRSYKDDNDQWQHTNTFYEDDMLRLGRLAGKAYDIAREHRREFARSAEPAHGTDPRDEGRRREPARSRGRQYRR
ncbi:MAG: hypothetical protein MRY64_14800 [Hyphomonadaceae bacterium]|nr:hypothetical protein [Hyphomonadaceae bacterium]